MSTTRRSVGPRAQPQARPAAVRRSDFEEVDGGFTLYEAMAEATRCVQCSQPPCAISGCRLGNDIPRWIDHLAHGRLQQAAAVLETTSNFPEMCGKLCPQEVLCESRCVLAKVGEPVAIGRLEEFVGKTARKLGWTRPVVGPKSGRRVAIVGSGPAGLAAAEQLLHLGHEVVIYERERVAGGVPVYGIPRFKYAKEKVAAVVARLQEKGARFLCGVRVGQDVTVDALFGKEGFDAVLLATGALCGRRLDAPGANLDNILLATDFLVRANLGTDYLGAQEPVVRGRRCVVVGGGDTALDCLRTALRLGFEGVVCLYRRSMAEMPGRREDRQLAAEEGARFELLAAPVRFVGSGRVERIICQRFTLGEPDVSGRRRPVPKAGDELVLEADLVVLALGFDIDAGMLQQAGCTLGGGSLVVDDGMATGRAGLFAAGDVVVGADLIVSAVVGGRRAARGIDDYLRQL